MLLALVNGNNSWILCKSYQKSIFKPIPFIVSCISFFIQDSVTKRKMVAVVGGNVPRTTEFLQIDDGEISEDISEESSEKSFGEEEIEGSESMEEGPELSNEGKVSFGKTQKVF